MKQKIQFTAIMSIFNRDDLNNLFYETVNSVIKNSIKPNYFYIIVDGPVSQKFKKKIIKVQNKYKIIKIFWLKKNIGEAKAINKILPKVLTEWIVKVDGDDFNYPDRFQELKKYMVKGYDLIGSNICEVNEKNRILYKKKTPSHFQQIKRYSKFRNPFNHMTVAFKKVSFLKVGGYPDIYLKEDYALWALFIKNKFKLINIDKVLVRAKINDNFYLRRGGLKYIISEIKLQKHLVNCGINNFFESIVIFFARAILLSLNSNLKKLIYKILLR